MRAPILAVFLCGTWAGAVGCGGSDSGGAGDRDQFLAQLCAEFSSCCAAAGLPSDGAQCRAFYGAFAPKAGYDATAAQACLDEVRATGNQKCDTNSANTPSCGKVFAAGGTKKPGEVCDTDSDCAPAEAGDVQCASDFVNGATVQQCQVRLPGKAGSTPCVGTVDGDITFSSGSGDSIPATGYVCDVADGLSCDSQTGACKALAAVGEACSNGFYQCVSSAYCSFSDSMCKERLALGAACSNDDECQASAHCDESGKTCAARHALGEACTTSAECESDDCTNQKCAAGGNLALAFLCGSN